MSVLLHLCLVCQHPSERHEPRHRAYTSCGCCNAGNPDTDPQPVLRPTFAARTGRAEPLVPPGATRNDGTMHVSRTCACQACQAAYDRARNAD